MISQLMIAGAAVLALTTGAGPEAAAPASPAAPGGSAAAAKPSQKRSEQKFKDHVGNHLTVEVDDAGKVTRAVWRDGKSNADLETHQLKVEDLSVCSPRSGGNQLCQPLTYLSDGAVFRLGTGTCTCCKVLGTSYCYGSTCK